MVIPEVALGRFSRWLRASTVDNRRAEALVLSRNVFIPCERRRQLFRMLAERSSSAGSETVPQRLVVSDRQTMWSNRSGQRTSFSADPQRNTVLSCILAERVWTSPRLILQAKRFSQPPGVG